MDLLCWFLYSSTPVFDSMQKSTSMLEHAKNVVQCSYKGTKPGANIGNKRQPNPDQTLIIVRRPRKESRETDSIRCVWQSPTRLWKHKKKKKSAKIVCRFNAIRKRYVKQVQVNNTQGRILRDYALKH